MKHSHFGIIMNALLILSLARSSWATVETAVSDDLSQWVVIELEPVLDHDKDSEPLSPKEYYPLGMGIRKNSSIHLVPFCVAVNHEAKTCTHAQYFEIKSGQFVDSDRVMDVRYGAPQNRVTVQGTAFHGKAIGLPFTGYEYSSGAIEELVQTYISRFYIPNSLSIGEIETNPNHDLFGEAGPIKLTAAGAAIGGLLGVMVLQPSSWGNFGRGLAIGAVVPHLVVVGVSVGSHLRTRSVSKAIERKRVRILDAFTKSKRIRENWTLIKSVKVPAKTYDAFVEFLSSASAR